MGCNLKYRFNNNDEWLKVKAIYIQQSGGKKGKISKCIRCAERASRRKALEKGEKKIHLESSKKAQ
jgi:hypothetical protein